MNVGFCYDCTLLKACKLYVIMRKMKVKGLWELQLLDFSEIIKLNQNQLPTETELILIKLSAWYKYYYKCKNL